MSTGAPRSIFRYAADRRSLLIVSLGLVLTVAPYIFFKGARPPWYFFPIGAILQTVVSQICGGIEHNHCHVKTFHSKGLNGLFSVMLSLAMGRPATYLVIPHNLNHHTEFGSEEDWSDPRQIRGQRGFFGVVVYSWRVFWVMTLRGYKSSSRRSYPKVMRMVAVENVIVAAWVIFLGSLNPGIFFLATLPGFLLANFGLLSINLFQHAYCDFSSFHNNSRNFVSPVYNWLSCNSGYHTYHHSYPMVHWSLLPERHREHIDPLIREDLNCPSYLKWVFLDYYRVDRSRPIVDLSPGMPPAVSVTKVR